MHSKKTKILIGALAFFVLAVFSMASTTFHTDVFVRQTATVNETLIVGNSTLGGIITDDGVNILFNFTRNVSFVDGPIINVSSLRLTAHSAETCNSAAEGKIFYNSSLKQFYGCNSTDWNLLG